MTYTMSDDKEKATRQMKNFERRMFILMKRNQGWTLKRIGEHLGITRQAVNNVWQKIKKTSIEDLEKEYQQYLND